MEGVGGELATIHHLAGLENYTQYISINNEHRSEEHNFSYSGTNGFTSTIDAEA